GKVGAVVPAGMHAAGPPPPLLEVALPELVPPPVLVLLVEPPLPRVAESVSPFDEHAATNAAAKIAQAPPAISSREPRSPPIPFAIRVLRGAGKLDTYIASSWRADLFVSCTANRRIFSSTQNENLTAPWWIFWPLVTFALREPLSL